MRRKSTRSAAKAPEKPPVTPKKTRRTSRRRKPSTSESSNEDSDDNVPLKMVATQVEETVKSSPSDRENPSPEEAVWTVTNTVIDPPSGEIQKLKICLTRPSPEKTERRRRNQSRTEDDERERSIVDDSAEEPKGKSKSKSKSKSDRNNAPIRGNAQVTTQSPQIVEDIDSKLVHSTDYANVPVTDTPSNENVPPISPSQSHQNNDSLPSPLNDKSDLQELSQPPQTQTSAEIQAEPETEPVESVATPEQEPPPETIEPEPVNNHQEAMETSECEQQPPVSNEDSKVEEETPREEKVKSKKILKRTIEEIDDNQQQTCPKWVEKFLDIEPHILTITSDLFAKIEPDLSLMDEEDVRMEIDIKERQKRYERKVSVEYKSENEKTEIEEENEPEANTTNIIAMNRKISIVEDTASKLKPPPSPAKNTLSEVLFITNLVRPFTLKQLKELLERTGKIKENGFWTDHIKSKCYVCYETVEEAVATRNALHGVHWPIGNGKKLIIDYSTEEELEKARNPPPPVVVPPPVQVDENQKKEEVPVREAEKKNDSYVREWDIGKERMYEIEKDYGKTYDNRDKHKRRRSPTPEYTGRKQKKIEEDIPQKLMDDLFNKTKSTPSIYWLPLTPEEITLKQQQRLLRMAEHKRRLEESHSHRGRGGPFRRRYD